MKSPPKWFKQNRLMNRLLIVLMAACLISCSNVHAIAHKIKAKLSALIHKTETPPESDLGKSIAMVSGVRVIKDFAYGNHPRQRMDIYAPVESMQSTKSPIVVMLHGGAWFGGDKASKLIYINKVNRWLPKGFIVISVETRALPEADVYAQIDDLAHAVAAVQKNAETWGGDPAKLFLMGHSSAGTMVSVLAAKPSLVTKLGGVPWLASFSLDSSSLDIPRTMRLWRPDMFVNAYGEDESKWRSASPIDLLSHQSLPLFMACSTQRPDSSCEQAQLFVDQANNFNVKTEIVALNVNHGEVNDQLGTNEKYTSAAENFMASLDNDVARRLGLSINQRN